MSMLLSIGISNALLASILAVVIWLATRRWRNPAVSHALWLLVLAKLLTPPLVNLSIPRSAQNVTSNDLPATIYRAEREPRSLSSGPGQPTEPDSRPTPSLASEVSRGNELHVVPSAAPLADAVADASRLPRTSGYSLRARFEWVRWLGLIWLAGSGSLLVVFASRIVRFHRLLGTTSPAPGRLQQLAESLRKRLQVRSAIEVRLAVIETPPLLWPLGRRKLILLPAALLEKLDERELETVFVHELAHVKRCDHLVRWVELAAILVYWWLPTLWWVRRQLRETEEAACDAWVVSALPRQKRHYVSALLQIAARLDGTRPSLPVVASGLGEGRRLIRRIEGLIATQPPRLGWRGMLALALTALLILPTSYRVSDAASQEEADIREAGAETTNFDEAADDHSEDTTAGDRFTNGRTNAIGQGVDFLKRAQREDGSWGEWTGFNGGMTALCTLALLEAGVSPTDEVLVRSLEWLRENDQPKMTYVVSLVTRVYSLAGLPGDRERIQRNADWLASSMVQEGAERGSWGYQKDTRRGDHSNACYALLGLEAAQAAGAKVPQEVWRAARDYWVRAQHADGSWGYQSKTSGTGSMTASGISALAITSSNIGDLNSAGDSRGTSVALDRAYDWMARHYLVAGNPNPGAGNSQQLWHYYYLAALTSACRLTQQTRLGEHDWRIDTADLLLREQHANGSWTGHKPEDNPHLATSFALIVLAQGAKSDSAAANP